MPLYRFIEEKAEQQCRQITPARDPIPARQLSSLEPAVRIMQLHADLALARDKARAATINDLIAGRIVGLGRQSDSYNFERVDDSFWIGAKVDWIGDTASRDGRTVIEVRIVRPGDTPSFQPKLHEVPGRPSKSDVISEAIAEYAKTDPTLERPPMERLRAYYAYISARDYNPRRDKGFSEKTIQKFERLFRSKYR